MIRPSLRALFALVLLFACSAAGAATALSPDSLYQLDATFTDQAGKSFTLADQRGEPVLIAMFYTSCPFVCPLIVDSGKGIEKALSADELARVRIVLVSIDPDRDDTAALKKIADQRGLDPARWTLARTDADSVRRLAGLLGVRYRALADGEFNHTSAMYLLDGQGRKLAHTEKLGPVPEAEFLQSVHASLTSSH